MHRFIFEVKRGYLKDIAAQFFPGFGLRENGVTEGASVVPAFFGIANFED